MQWLVWRTREQQDREHSLNFGVGSVGPGRDWSLCPVWNTSPFRAPSMRFRFYFRWYFQYMAQLTLVWMAAFSSSGNIQIDSTFFALTGLCQSWCRGQFLPVPLSCPWPSGLCADLIVSSWVYFALSLNRTKEYLPSPIFKGFPFPFGFVVQQTTSSLTQLPNYLNSLWHLKGDLHPVLDSLVPFSHTCSHLKWCHQAVVNSWQQLLCSIQIFYSSLDRAMIYN